MLTYYFFGENLEQFTNIVVISRTLTHGTYKMLERKGIQYRTCVELQPDWKTMVGPYKNGTLTENDYERLYTIQLNRLDPHTLFNQLGSDAVLVCYEPSNKFCHRHIVAKWLSSHGYHTEEFNGKIRKISLDGEFVL
jgi:hypothetical protein